MKMRYSGVRAIGFGCLIVGLSLVTACGSSASDETQDAPSETSSMSASMEASEASPTPSTTSPEPVTADTAGYVTAIRSSIPNLNEPDSRIVGFGEQLCENNDPQELRNEVAVLAMFGLEEAGASSMANAAFTYLCPDKMDVYTASLGLSVQ